MGAGSFHLSYQWGTQTRQTFSGKRVRLSVWTFASVLRTLFHGMRRRQLVATDAKSTCRQGKVMQPKTLTIFQWAVGSGGVSGSAQLTTQTESRLRCLTRTASKLFALGKPDHGTDGMVSRRSRKQEVLKPGLRRTLTTRWGTKPVYLTAVGKYPSSSAVHVECMRCLGLFASVFLSFLTLCKT